MNNLKDSVEDGYLSPLSVLSGVGPQIAQKLAQEGFATLHDLVLTLPTRYADKTKLTAISDIMPGETVLIEAVLEKKNVFYYSRKRSLNCRLADGSDYLDLKFYYYTGFHDKRMNVGETFRCYGKAREGRSGIEIIHPEYEMIEDGTNKPLDKSFTPIYKNLKGIGQKAHRKLVLTALEYIRRRDTKDLVKSLSADKCLMDLTDALHIAHFPNYDELIHSLANKTHPAQERIALEELIAYQLLILNKEPEELGIKINGSLNIIEDIIQILPFEITSSQRNALFEMIGDLNKKIPMNRLLQGDVGCGKTLVALLLSAYVAKAGYQVAVMAPTEILARQHYQEFLSFLAAFNIDIQFLSGSLSSEQKQSISQEINHSKNSITIGTHALFQEHINFNNLGLVIVDEQHRFGVKQRLSLRKKRKDSSLPHQVFMTATPIPRTIAMTLFSDMTISTINEMPVGRLAVETSAIPRTKKREIIKRIERMMQVEKSQVYWVSPIISESEHIDVEAAEDIYKDIKKMLPKTKIGLVHGKMSNEEKDEVMNAFKEGHIQMLVSTTLIEVGVNVPNATCMVIEGVERMGLSQIHQLRGRVGRGSKPSFCLLLYKLPLSHVVQERLGIIRENSDGFKIAEKDFAMRGPGNIFGVEQSGVMNFQLVDLGVHFHLIYDAKQVAEKILETKDQTGQQLLARWYPDSKEYILA